MVGVFVRVESVVFRVELNFGRSSREPYLDMPSFTLHAPVPAFSVATTMHCRSTATRRIRRHVLD